MKSKHFLIMAGALAVLASCTTRTVVYHQPPPKPVTRTVYVSSPPPATLPGQAYKLPDPGSPSNFRASGDN